MPAARSRLPLHHPALHNPFLASTGAPPPLAWAVLPAPAPPAHSIAFAPTMTPVSFVEPFPAPAVPACAPDAGAVPARAPPSTPPPPPPPSARAPEFSPPFLADPASAPIPPAARRTTHGRKRGEDHIPRPPNAFILFRSSFIKSQHVSSGVETNHSTLSKIIGLMWQNMPHDERQLWHAKAKKALEEHRRRWPQYAFRPAHAKARGTAEKRRVREVEPKDMKRCAKIAQLLVEGKKGAELDVAIQEFDRTHVPEIVTRFETPITARSFRRSSSAPVDADQPKKPFLANTTSSPPCRRVRSCSSQPSLQESRCTEQPVLPHLPRAPQPLVSSLSCPDLSVPPSFHPHSPSAYAKPHEPTLELDPLMFDMVFGDTISPPGDLASYPCSPTEVRVDSPSLCFAAGYGNDWTPSSSPRPSLPPTPQALSPVLTFDHSGIDDLFALGPLSLGGMTGHGDEHGLPPCGQYSAGLDGYHHGLYLDAVDGSGAFGQTDQGFGMYAKEPFVLPFGAGGKLELAGVDSEFSTFMSSLSGF